MTDHTPPPKKPTSTRKLVIFPADYNESIARIAQAEGESFNRMVLLLMMPELRRRLGAISEPPRKPGPRPKIKPRKKPKKSG